ncbi:MAG: glucose-1-phosphate cytidylyltransferase [Clostridia bacterium]|nr:glucose-1-phosphate cytidylyltransferase [Clostridia bacterium]
MKAVILAGGFGTRISEESHLRPKPMIEIGEMPIIWHIMKQYSHFGINEFVICAGYKQSVIKEWFANYFIHTSDITFDFRSGNTVTVMRQNTEPWVVSVVDTGLRTMTGGRLKRVKKYIGDETFCLTYGDGVSDVDIGELIKFHKSHGKLATVTAVRPESRFGYLEIADDDSITAFREKSAEDVGWINGGFMCLEPGVIDYIGGDETTFEAEPMEKLAAEGQLVCRRHYGFWQCMDTLRDKEKLEKLWQAGNAPWKY